MLIAIEYCEERGPVGDEFSCVMNALPASVWTALPDGNVDFLNQHWTKYTGVSLDQARGVGWQSTVHPEDLSEVLERWHFILASGKAGDLEARLCRFDGDFRWFLVSCNPMLDEAGRVVKWFVVNTDIDEQKSALETLRPGELDLGSIINTIPMMAWSAEIDGYCDFCNQCWRDYTGLPLEQVRGWGWETVIHPDELDGLVGHWQSSLASGEPVNTEARMRRYDGVYRWFLFLGNPLRDESGKVIKWFGTNVDIEDRKLAEDAIRANERNLIQIINTIPTTAWSTRPDGYCDFLSQRWLDYAGFTEEEARGWNWGGAIHPDDVNELVEYWQGCLAAGTPARTEARIRRWDGVYRWFLFLANPLRDQSGTIIKWYGTNVDIEDRKQADEALQASAFNLNLIINTIPMLAWSTGPDGFVDFLNRRWLEFTGMSAIEASGWGWTAAIHPDDVRGLQNYWQTSLAAGTEVDVEARMRRFDGEYRWFLFRASPLRDETGNIVKWYGTNVDIEDRKRADAALQVINTIPTIAWSTRPDGYCDFINQRWMDYTGLTLDSTLGWGWRAVTHPDDLNGLVEHWQGCLNTGAPVNTEARLRRFDGVYRWFLFVGNPLRDESGTIVRWFGLDVEIEDRKQAEEELRRSEAFLAEGQRLNLTGSFSWCLDTDKITFSDELYRIHELERETPITLGLIASRLHPEDVQMVSEKIALARVGGSDLNLSYDCRLRMSDNSVKYLRTVAHTTRDREGRLEVIGAVQDVTERKLSEEALGKVRSELARMARVASLGALTASIAHEVSQPLSGIITNANTGLRMLAVDPPNVAGVLETVRRTLRDGNRASEVISKLRALFSKNNFTTELVDLNEATQEVITLLLSELQRNRVILRSELSENLPTVIGDRIQLQQVISNLLLNASEAMSNVDDHPRQLIVKTDRDDDQSVRLSVCDAGVGIDPQNINQLFDAFYTTKNGSMGMGLSVSRSIIESHHGLLSAWANDGAGATFSFTMPHVVKDDNAGSTQELALDKTQNQTKGL
jgi:PAS domain S-box-containing protein